MEFFKKHWWKFAAGLLIILVVGIFGLGQVKRYPSSENIQTRSTSTAPSPNAPYITANPIDLSQIEKISKFRSCAGHDNSGHNFFGEVETDRSMKHYVKPLAAFDDDKARIHSPFDGTVYSADGPHPELGPGQARGGSLELMSSMEPHAVVLLGHITALAGLKKGDTVQSGQLLGYATTSGGSDFDLVLRAINQPGAQSTFGDTFDSVFNHMTPQVLAEYAKFGLTKDAMFFSKEFRDQHPCLFGTVAAEPNERSGPQPDIQTSPDNWVFLKTRT